MAVSLKLALPNAVPIESDQSLSFSPDSVATPEESFSESLNQGFSIIALAKQQFPKFVRQYPERCKGKLVLVDFCQ